MKLLDMSRAERSLLLFFETCAVDYAGRVNPQRMNDWDHKIVDGWVKSNFVDYGRIASKDHNRQGSNWVVLSDSAWTLAHEERRARYERNERRYQTTKELNNDLG